MDFATSVTTCLKKYFQFEGRASRSEFWWFWLFGLLVSLVLGWIPFLGWLAVLALVIPQLTCGARRLHDVGKTAWLLLVGFIPFIGWAILLYFAIQPSEEQANRWGEVPSA